MKTALAVVRLAAWLGACGGALGAVGGGAGGAHPGNFLQQLPSLALPYVGSLRIPANVPVRPTPPLVTKVVSIVTAYVYRNPVCVKAADKGRKALCKRRGAEAGAGGGGGLDRLVTKEYYVNDVRNWAGWRRRPAGRVDEEEEEKEEEDRRSPAGHGHSARDARLLDDDDGLYIEASEPAGAPGSAAVAPTPALGPRAATLRPADAAHVQALLIEDGLDQLEALLPAYTRRRLYQTTTITVTKVRSNRRATATLLAKNCIPQGYDICPVKLKRRKAKVDGRLFGHNGTGWE